MCTTNEMEDPVAIEALNLFPENTVENLTSGLLSVLEPEISRVLQSVNELTYVWV